MGFDEKQSHRSHQSIPRYFVYSTSAASSVMYQHIKDISKSLGLDVPSKTNLYFQ